MMIVLHKNVYTRIGVNLKFGGGDSSKNYSHRQNQGWFKVNATGVNVANGEVVNSESGVQNVADVVGLTDFYSF